MYMVWVRDECRHGTGGKQHQATPLKLNAEVPILMRIGVCPHVRLFLEDSLMDAHNTSGTVIVNRRPLSRLPHQGKQGQTIVFRRKYQITRVVLGARTVMRRLQEIVGDAQKTQHGWSQSRHDAGRNIIASNDFPTLL